MSWRSRPRFERCARHASTWSLLAATCYRGRCLYETLACLMALEIPVHFIQGNGDRVVATHLAGGDISEVPQAHREVIEWTAWQLTADDRQAIARWPSTVRARRCRSSGTHSSAMPRHGATPRSSRE